MKNNPRQMYVEKAVLSESSMDDACYYCDEIIPRGTRCVVLWIDARDASYWGRRVKVHMHPECWARAGKYPAVAGLSNPVYRRNQWQAAIPAAAGVIGAGISAAPRLLEFTERHPTLFKILPWNWRRNPPLVTEAKKITKGKGIQPTPCQYCGQPVAEGEECIRVRVLAHNVYGHAQTFYIHIPCWERAGMYPPLYEPKHPPLPKSKNPMGDKLWKELSRLSGGAVLKRFAIQYVCDVVFKEGPGGSVFFKMPDGSTREVKSDFAAEMHQVEPYWCTWREFEHLPEAMEGAEGFLRSHLHNLKAGHPWVPIRVVGGDGRVMFAWNTPEEAERDLGKSNPLDPKKKAARFRALAASLEKQIDSKRHPAIADQNLTARRARIAEGMARDADHLEKIQHILRGMAAATENGTLSPALEKIASKAQIERLLWGSDEGVKAALNAYVKGPSAEVKKEQEEKRLVSSLIGSRIPGFFPTPAPLVERLIEIVSPILPGMKVLEPSAGKGDIADAIRAKCPECRLTVVELMHTLVEILKAKGYTPVQGNFLEFNRGKYDRIIMNPPFDRLQDIAHVRHAYSLLAPGGQLVSLMGPHAFFGTDRKSVEFRAWLREEHGLVFDVTQGAFTGRQSFRQTGTSSKIVLISKPRIFTVRELSKFWGKHA